MSERFDAVTLEVFRALFESIADEMGTSLRRTGFSPNIKERRDYSCAVFDRAGQLVAQGDHMPVHLGSMQTAVGAAISAFALHEGDVVLLNDPFAGGTHLPDLTTVAPVYGEGGDLQFYVAARAHHADVGGAQPGSMGASTDVYGEGLVIPPCRLVKAGEVDRELLALVLANMRVRPEREGDLAAQLGAIEIGARRLRELSRRYGFALLDEYARHLIDYAARHVRVRLAAIPDGCYGAEDWLDSGGRGSAPVRICVTLLVRGETLDVDFTGSDPQVGGPLNAVESITRSAVFYVVRSLIPADVPASAGILAPVTIRAPLGSVVNARSPAAVAGGNVETSQRIVDVLLRALAAALPGEIPAASQGTMNNLTIGGVDPRTGEPFAYYETVAGGTGAWAGGDGLDAVHSHMTNSLNTPVEALEYAYPLRVTEYSIRRGSGGPGRWRGGDGVVREIEALCACRATILSDRRRLAPWGLAGGDGSPGVNLLVRRGGERTILEACCTVDLEPGDRVRIETPGGGGYG